ncbi:MAG: ATP-binding protein [Bacteroidales bacterium]|nr:ATP-binding protein [Bacteroidales bacterium]MBN2818999.1 ATP-binding protein [Bacteroidales bacterium]
MEFEYPIEGGDFTRAGMASSQVKKVLKQLNIAPAIIKRIAVAMYEAEVNVVAHAFKGTMLVNIMPDKVFIKFIDEGPGIHDIDLAMQEGFSTATESVRQMGFGAGMGLPNIKKNVDELQISSVVNKGTTVELTTYIS